MADERETGLDKLVPKGPLSRREFLRVAGLAGATVGVGGILAGCGGGTTTTTGATAGGTETTAGVATTAGAATGREIKIGYVSPETGAFGGFGEADKYVVDGVNKIFANGITINGTTHPVTIVVKDSQSNPDTAGKVAGDLILNDNVDLMVVSSTPETANPVSDQCEANGVPCVSTVVPWQAWYFNRQKDPNNPAAAVPFQWTYHFFWGLEDIIGVFTRMWDTVPTNKVVGALWPNDGDGKAWSSPQVGFPPALTKAGYTLVDPGRYENGTDDFSAQIDQFKKAGVQIVTGVPIPPDWATFWTQAQQQSFQPKIASVGKALLFPSSVDALPGTSGDGMSTEVWWTPSHPYSSSLTGESSKQLADGYTTASGKQWTQPIGFVHALFEVANDVFKRTTDIDSRDAVLAAVKATNFNSIVGPINFTTGQPVPNVSKTPLVGGQWGLGTQFKYDMVIVENANATDIPTGGTLRPIPYS